MLVVAKRLAAATVVVTALSMFGAPSEALARPAAIPNPDFTRGEKIPEDAVHDWTLGATGARGWMYCHRLETTKARQIAITKVAKGSPADGVLAVGDVILGVDGKRFSYDPRTEFGKALTRAETVAGRGELSLILWRSGGTRTVVVRIPVLGSYSDTAPYNCMKSSRILKRGCATLAKRVADPGYGGHPIVRSLNALALLASGDPQYLPLVRKEASWGAEFSADSMQTWSYGYVVTMLAEYVLATGDDSVRPGLRRLALEAARGQSIVGSWGHRFANPDGRLGGYGMMNSPGLPLTIGLVLAAEAGVAEPEIAQAIDRSAKLMRFYIGKGAVPYGDHHPWTQTHEDNGKCGMASVLFDFLGEPKGAEYFSRMCVASHGAERDTGHTGNYFNMTWSIPGVSRSGPHATGAWIEEFGWYFDLARGSDGTFTHQGPPQTRNDSYGGWDETGAYLLAYAMPLREIRLTGRVSSTAPRIDRAGARSLIEDGRGWSNDNRTGFYDTLPVDELMRRLGSWSPTVRARAGEALARRKTDVRVPALLTMLDSPSIYVRYGACDMFKSMRSDAAPAVPALKRVLNHPDMWLRVKAADALAAIGEAAMPAAPQLLRMVARGPTREDPRAMEQRYLCFALFNRRGGLLSRSLEGVDREALYAAVRAGLKNQDGRARGSIGSVYGMLSFEQLEPLLPAIYRAVMEPAPSGIMFADGIRIEGLKLLAKHRIREGIDACAHYTRTQNPWASEKRTPQVMKILLSYGAQAKPIIPRLEEIARYFDSGEPKFPQRLSLQKAQNLRDTISAIEASNEYPELIHIESINDEERP
jgi:hypothetical protein